MKMNNTWVVPVDFSPIDLEVIDYVKYLGASQKPEKVHFVNVMKEFKQSYYGEFEGFQDQLRVDQKLRLENKVKMHFNEAGIPYECHILSGTAFQEIIGLVLNKAASLVILGKKRTSSGSGVVSDRLSRNLPCDVLLVNEDFVPKLDNVLIPTDFSAHSDLAMNQLLGLMNEMEMEEKPKLFAFHTYDIPLGYDKSGKSYEEFAEIVRSNVETDMSEWIKKFDHDITPILLLQKENSFAELVMDQVETQDIDLIVMGSRGQTPTSLALLGSNTMKVLMKNDQVPVLIVKKPGENMSFIDSMRN